MPDNKEKPKKIDVDKVSARRVALLAKVTATTAALDKGKKTIAAFDDAVKSCPDD